MQTVLIGGPGHRQIVKFNGRIKTFRFVESEQHNLNYSALPDQNFDCRYKTYNYTSRVFWFERARRYFLLLVLDSLSDDIAGIYTREEGLEDRILEYATESWR